MESVGGINARMPGLPDDAQSCDVLGSQNDEHFHVLVSWRQDNGSVYVYSASTRRPSSAAAERWARDQILIHHERLGEPDVVSVMTHDEWAELILDVRRRIGD